MKRGVRALLRSIPIRPHHERLHERWRNLVADAAQPDFVIAVRSRTARPSVGSVSRVVFMCGPAGSGKSTVARRLEDEGMTRLSFDQESWRRGIRSMPLSPALHQEIEIELRTRLLDLVASGVDVVLDFSFWSRRSRDDYRDLLRPRGVEPETIYLATPRETVLERMRTRRVTHGDDYALSDDVTKAYFDHFEPPTGDEGPVTVIR